MGVCHKPGLRCLSHSNNVVRQVISLSNPTFFVVQHRCFVARHVFCNQLINYLLTGYLVRTEKYQALSHVARTSLRSVVLCDFELSIFQYGRGNQLINRYDCLSSFMFPTTVYVIFKRLFNCFHFLQIEFFRSQ